MADPRDIRFRKKGGVVTIRIKVGNEWVDRSGGWYTIKEATAPAIELRDKLQAEYAAAHPELAAKEAEVGPDDRKPRQGEKSLRQRAEEERANYCKRQRLRDTHNGESALNWLFSQLGDKADLPPRLQKVQYFTKVRNAFVDGPLAKRTVELYSKLIREVLHRIPDLNANCLLELENLPKKEVSIEASGEPFQRRHFEVMFARVGSASETTQLLFWFGASGGQQIGDSTFTPLWAYDDHTGMIRYFRIKTGERIEFCALPPLRALLDARKKKLGPGAVFALPELIFTKSELKDPKCNTVGWEGFKDWDGFEGCDGLRGWDKVKVPKDIADRGAGNGTKVINAFLEQCGIKADGITNKSFRKHDISFWASIGIELKTRMRMAGHSKESSHYRYVVPADFAIIRASEIMWLYYQAIMKREDFFLPTTTYDIYEALMAFMREAFDSQTALVEAQARTLQAENAQLRQQLEDQRQQLAAIRHFCHQLTKHFGLPDVS